MASQIISATFERLSEASARRPFVATSVMITVVTAVSLPLDEVLHASNIDALYLLVVFVTALKWGRRPALFAALTSSVVFDFCFIPPRFSFAITDLPYFVTLFVFITVAVATSELASRAQRFMREHAARSQAEAVAHAKDALLNRIAHELRTPLATILGWVQVLRQNGGNPERVARGLAGLERNAQLLVRLAADLLDVSRIHVGKLTVHLEPVALAPIIQRALEDAAFAAAEKGVALEASINPVGTTLADEHRIEQVVTNLVSNALKFTGSGGRVSVTLDRDDGFARLVVADTGIGIPADFLPRVFEPFAQEHGDNGPQGLGLGLAIVKHLVEAHRGRITVESGGRGRGTTFIVELPLSN